VLLPPAEARRTRGPQYTAHEAFFFGAAFFAAFLFLGAAFFFLGAAFLFFCSHYSLLIYHTN
jgi:hypothetical protein